MNNNTRGFSLIEVLIAITLVAVISIMIWQSMGTTVRSKERTEHRDRVFRTASMAIEKISQDLSMAVMFSNVELLGVSVSGEQQSKVVFIGTNQGDQDRIIFDSFSHVRYLKDSKESDLAEITYWLEPDTERSGQYLLKKREVSPPTAQPERPVESHGKKKIEKGENVMTLLEGVLELNFRYYNPQKADYVDDWDSTKADFVGRLPKAVEISLKVQDPEDEDHEEEPVKFETQVFIELSPGPSDF